MASTSNESQRTMLAKKMWEKIKKAFIKSRTKPTMVFSVIGDSDSFVPRPWPITVFQMALIEAAKSGGETWILYRGKNDGVSQVVKDAYQQYLELEFGTEYVDMKSQSRHITLIDPTDVKIIFNMRTGDEKDIIQGENEDPFLKYEKNISKYEVSYRSHTLNISMPVPIIILVCEGDLKTIAHISEALENKIPAVIMKGSGKAADLVSDYLENESVLDERASIHFGIHIDNTKYEEMKTYLKQIAKHRNLVGIFDLQQHDPHILSNIVGERIVIGWSLTNIPLKYSIENKTEKIQTTIENVQQKETSLTLNIIRKTAVHPAKIDIKGLKKQSKAYVPYVLNPKYSKPTSLPLYFYFGYQLLQESNSMDRFAPILLLEALKANHCDYVRVLLAKGVNFRKKDLLELYTQAVKCKDCKFKKDDCLHMQWILKQIEELQAITLFHYNPNKENEKENIAQFYEKEVPDAARRLCCRILHYQFGSYKDSTEAEDEKSNILDISDILLWAILANRKELAEICWLRGKNHLLTGLVCTAILRKLSQKASNVKEHILSDELEEHAKLFEQRCIALMDSMYTENTQHAIYLMDDEAVVWGIRSSPLTFAHENFMYEIVAHTCAQKNMNRQWYNNLAPDLKLFFKVKKDL